MNRTDDILSMRREGMTLKAIGDRYNITPQRVQQICKQHAPDLASERNWRSISASKKYDDRRQRVLDLYRGGTRNLHEIGRQTNSSYKFVRTTLSDSGDIQIKEPWTQDQVVSAMIEWRRLHGSWPRSDQWMRRGSWWPCRATVVGRFGWKSCLDHAKVRWAQREMAK